MADEIDSGAHRLHSGAPWWLLQNGLLDQAAPLHGPIDVAIVGAGITGALIGDALTAGGARVALFDRRSPATGSTAVSTGLLQYEIDVPLAELISKIGEPDAARVYRLSWEAIDRVEQIAATLPVPVGFVRKPSLYLATRRRDLKHLDAECEARMHHGLHSERLSRSEVAARFGIPGHGALLTPQAGEVDPVALTRGLLERAISRGASLVSRTTVHNVRRSGAGFVLETDRGEVAAGQVVFALGYEMPPRMLSGLVRLQSTFAVVTEPADDHFPFKNPVARDALLAPRARRLEKRLSKLLPGIQLQTAFAWSGTFAETRDGLPLIGPCAELHGAFVALGYGGNGITFGVIAADILSQVLLGRMDMTGFTCFDPAR